MSSSRRVDATIQCRMRSSRLPGKALLPLAGVPALQRLIERVRRSRRIERVIVATSDHPADDQIAELAERLGAPCYRGSEEDVLGRVVGALRSFDVEVHVELQGDNLVPDPSIIDEVVDYFLAHESECDYVTNGLVTTYPPGSEVAVYTARTLYDAERLDDGTVPREHVGPHIYRRPDVFRVRNLEAPPELRAPSLHFEIDTAEDYAVVRSVYEHFLPSQPEFTLSDAIHFARTSGVGERNRDVPRRWRVFRDDTSL